MLPSKKKILRMRLGSEDFYYEAEKNLFSIHPLALVVLAREKPLITSG